MRIVIHRVVSGSVTVGGVEISRIKRGLIVLAGFGKKDGEEKIKESVEKILRICLWPKQSQLVCEADEGKAELIKDDKQISKDLKDSSAGPSVDQREELNWVTNVVENDFEILLISQFTLFAEMKGNKPDFHGARDNREAKEMFEIFVGAVKAAYRPDRVQTGAFGEYTAVEINNDGCVTFSFEL